MVFSTNKINNETITDTSLKADSFNTYFTNFGSNLASNILPPADYSFKDYITHPVKHKFVLNLVTEKKNISIIDSFKRKHSLGHDRLSMNL